MAAPSEPLEATTLNVTLTAADTEYNVQLPLGTKHFSIQNRSAVVTRFAFETGHVATPTAPYTSIKSGGAYNSPEKFSGRQTVYLGTADATSPVVEIIAWSTPPRAQRDVVVIALTWATSDTITATIGTQTIVVTIGGSTTVAQVATTLKQAWNAETLTDGTASVVPTGGADDNSSFEDITATVNDTIVTLTGKNGVSFSLAITEVTAGNGTATETTETTVS